MQRLPFAAFKRFLEQATNIGCETVILSGGDPLMLPELPAYVSEAKARGLTVYIYSCGIVRSKTSLVAVGRVAIDELSRSGLDKVVFGVNSAREKRHDVITGYPGSLRETLKAAQRFIEGGIITEFQFVPMRPNWRDLPSLIDLAEKVGTSMLSILRFVPQGRGRLNASRLLMSRSEHLRFQEMLTKLVQDGNSSIIRVGAPFSPFDGVTQAGCTAGISRLYVAPSGDMFPCEGFKCALPFEVSGNSNMGIDAAWAKSNVLMDFRRLIAREPSHRRASGCPAQAFWARGSILPSDDPLVDIVRNCNTSRDTDKSLECPKAD